MENNESVLAAMRDNIRQKELIIEKLITEHCLSLMFMEKQIAELKAETEKLQIKIRDEVK
jgi:hypothetical protein